MVHNYIDGIANYGDQSKPLAFFSYIAGGFSKNIDAQIRSIHDATGVSGSAISVSNVIKMVEQNQQATYSHARIRDILSINRQVLLRDIV